jgi:elongation factor G
MRDYTTEKIRNVCFMGHGGSGKTSLTETIIFNTGILDRLGKVTEGTTVSDYDAEEIKRKISVSASLAPVEWKDTKINIIDTPGYFDFVGEVIQGVRVADGAVIVLSGKSSVTVGAEKSWEYASQHHLPVMFFISKLDEENSDVYKVYDQIKDTFGNKCILLQIPIKENDKLIGYIDVIKEKAYKYEGGKSVPSEIQNEFKDKILEIKETIKEYIAETDEVLMEKFFSGEEFTPEEFKDGMKKAILEKSIIPIYGGSSSANIGTDMIMDAISEYMPAPSDIPVVNAIKPNGEKVDIKVSPDEPFCALIFKTIADPFVGKISFFKVYSGTLKGDSTIYNPAVDKTEKVAQLFTLLGKKQINISKFVAGDIGAVAKLQFSVTGDTLCTQSNPVILEKIDFPEPMIALAIEPKTKGDEEKISNGLHRLQDEDRTFKVGINTETHQTLISGVGEQHLDIIVSKLKAKYGVEVNLTAPRVPYRETIRKALKAEGKHKKQSGGHGQYGHVFIEFAPNDSEEFVFEEKVFGGAVPRQYFPAVEKGLRDSILKGVLAGYPVVNLKATLVDGSFHPVDSSEMAFKIAANVAFKKGMTDASPTLLEPIVHVEVYVPDHYMGDIIGDLNKRRGRILGMNPQDGGIQQVIAEVPESEMFKYATDLRSITHARGTFKMWFVRYEDAPPMISQKIIEEAKKHMAEE